MGKKRRSRRSRKRFRYAVTLLIISFSSLLFLNTQIPRILRREGRLFNTPQGHQVQKPHSWFQKGSQPAQTSSSAKLMEQHSQSSAISSATPVKNAAREIPKGPYPLIPLNKSESETLQGSSWIASLTTRETGNLPLHWLAELIHGPPKIPIQPSSSIFTARRKGAWIGCDKSSWLICKAAYRAIKKTNAVTIIDTCCANNTKWLPDVINKLRSEFRLVRLTCIGKPVQGYDDKVNFLDINPFTDVLPNGADLLLAFKFVQDETLISAMKFFKNVKKAGVKYLLTENFPNEENIVKKVNNEYMLRLNVAMPPFWFPAPAYEYENEEENNEGAQMQIMVSRVEALFEEKLTPGMAELVDPRKRTVRE